VDKAKLCPLPTGPNPRGRLAIVVASSTRLIGWAAKDVGGEVCEEDGTTRIFHARKEDHAEEMLLRELATLDLGDAVAYVTLEPCAWRHSGTACAHLLIASGVRTVFVGNSDPHPDINCGAWRTFIPAGVKVLDFPPELRNEARRDNAAFFDKFVLSSALKGRASFDFTQSTRILGQPGKQFRTKWSKRGDDSVHAYGDNDSVCIAKGCPDLRSVDDPGRWFEDSDRAKPVKVGQIVIFRQPFGFALVKILSVRYGRGEEIPKLQFQYQIRYHSGTIRS
jgi:pyrimidine deaminase RibD-like protein